MGSKNVGENRTLNGWNRRTANFEEDTAIGEGQDEYHESFEQGGKAELSERAHTSDDALDRFDDITLALTVRCGSLRITLAELRSLAPGVVLDVEGPAPGLASLYYDDRVVADGELVDIEGRLGLQITRMDVKR